MSTVDEMLAALAAGRARKRVIFMDEAWYGPSLRDYPARGAVHDWQIDVEALTETGGPDGSFGSVELLWLPLGPGGPVWQLRAFGDGLPQVAACGLVELLNAATDATPEQMKELLAAAGWTDRTDRVGPYAAGGAR